MNTRWYKAEVVVHTHACLRKLNAFD